MSSLLKINRTVISAFSSEYIQTGILSTSDPLFFQQRWNQTVPQTKATPTPVFTSSMSEIVPIFKKALSYPERIALKDQHGRYSYFSLLLGSQSLSEQISAAVKNSTGERVAFLCPNDGSYVITQWAVWMSGQIAVPLSHLHPAQMIEYFVKDCEARVLVTTPKYAELMDEVATKTKRKLLVIDDSTRRIAMHIDEQGFTENVVPNPGQPNEFYADKEAMILYTSGTTGNPKGVVLTHKNLQAQMTSLINAWKLSANDTVLHILPLHHTHGIVNALMCCMYAGGRCVMMPKFDPSLVWSQLLGINVAPQDRVNVFHAVPTVYIKLIQEYDKIFKKNQRMIEYVLTTLKQKVRLMVSGSAPLPVSVYDRWKEITNHALLERYGMTEIGMCLSNTYKGDREPGYIGVPLPGVSVRLGERILRNEFETILECNAVAIDDYDDRNNSEPNVTFNEKRERPKENATGEILVKGDNVFKRYYAKVEETKNEFTSDGWFITGDLAEYDMKKNKFKMLGRVNVDIIKTGGYKVSSLQIETVLLSHPDIREIAVVALPDVTWGQKVAAVVVLKDGVVMMLPKLREWAKEKMTEYWVPTVLKIVDELPKNAMGKINKKALVKDVFPEYSEKTEEDVARKEN